MLWQHNTTSSTIWALDFFRNLPGAQLRMDRHGCRWRNLVLEWSLVGCPCGWPRDALGLESFGRSWRTRMHQWWCGIQGVKMVMDGKGGCPTENHSSRLPILPVASKLVFVGMLFSHCAGKDFFSFDIALSYALAARGWSVEVWDGGIVGTADAAFVYQSSLAWLEMSQWLSTGKCCTPLQDSFSPLGALQYQPKTVSGKTQHDLFGIFLVESGYRNWRTVWLEDHWIILGPLTASGAPTPNSNLDAADEELISPRLAEHEACPIWLWKLLHKLPMVPPWKF